MTPTPVKKISLDSGWEWKQRDGSIGDVLKEVQGDGWRKATQFPSEVHVELMKAGLIPDPYVGFNEHEVQWVGEVEWVWRSSFDVEEGGDGEMGLLEFEGLDTLCDVYLNDSLLFSADNQFRTWRHFFSLSSSSHYTLLLHFKSAKLHAKEEEAKYGVVRAGSTNLGDPSRVYVRKAQYDWRWDWGPELMTCGPYRPITLTTYTTGARIQDVYPRATLIEGHQIPKLEVDVTLDAADTKVKRKVRVTLKEHESAVVIREGVFPVEGKPGTTTVAKWEFRDGEVEKWWPSGSGEQTLYDVVVELIVGDVNNETTIHTTTKRIGFRTVSLIQEPLLEPDQYGKGTTFLFEVNGVRIFTGGSNYIPSSSLLTTISPTRYRRLLTLLRNGNQNMVRIWGGGVFEPDVFYDLCDELGLLVWHDFMFACGIYPGSRNPAFLESVEEEARDAVRRLRHHPAMALWCGNNEDYQQVLQWDLKSGSGGGDSKEISKEEKDRLLPAHVIYEQILPRVVAELMPASSPSSPSLISPDFTTQSSTVPYWPGSPYGGPGWDTSDPTRGDVHQWDVWGGKERAWQEYGRMGGRYVSEFGIPSFPDMKTVRYWMGSSSSPEINDEKVHAQSPIMAQHNRAGSHERRFAIVMGENFRVVEDLERHVYTTQLMQSEAVGLAYKSWRRGWKGRGREYTSGVLVWQANDCWPVTSWAIIDYFLRPEPVYHTISRSLAPVTISLHRRVPKNRPTDRPEQFYEFGAFQEGEEGAVVEVWGCNAGLGGREVKVEVRYWDLGDEGWVVDEERFRDQDGIIVLEPNQSTELGTLRIPAPARLTRLIKSTTRNDQGVLEVVDKEMKRTHSVVVSARLVDPKTGEVLARAVDWPQPFRYCEVPSEPGVRVVLVRRPDDRGEVDRGDKNEDEDEVRFRITVNRPVKGLWLSVDEGTGEKNDPEGEEEPRWSDNSLDLVPGDEWVVVLRGLGGVGGDGKKGWERVKDGEVKVKAAWFGREKAEVVGVEVE